VTCVLCQRVHQVGGSASVSSRRTAYRGAVVRQDRIEAPTTWLASVNAGHPGEYSDRGAAMARVQAEVEYRMEVPLHDRQLSPP
jgi:hypothetical protein